MNGGIILYPTDTIWGLGCDATNNDACRKLIALKQRGPEKSFIVLVDSIQMLEKYTTGFPDVCYDLIDLSDRPLTIIYSDVVGIAKNAKAQDGSVGIRVTKDPICLSLIQKLKKPIVSTSANYSGEPSPTCFDDISKKLKLEVDGIVMERLHEKRTTPSQVIKIGMDATVQVIRK